MSAQSHAWDCNFAVGPTAVVPFFTDSHLAAFLPVRLNLPFFVRLVSPLFSLIVSPPFSDCLPPSFSLQNQVSRNSEPTQSSRK